MRFTKMLTKSQKLSKVFDSINATYLIRGGFIDQTMSGVYSYLPLGLRVLRKIEAIVREEMDKIAEEVFMPSIVPVEMWKATGRLDSVDVLFKAVPANEIAKAKNDSEYVLNSTHEEVVTPLARRFAISYKDVPKAVYQIQTKFRNEARAKSGIMRGREFRMKDLYSFHSTVEDFKQYYEMSKQAYFNVFSRLGLGSDTVIAAASGGDFTDDFSHEFQTKCDTGEDTIFFAKSVNMAFNKEVAPSRAPKLEQEKDQKAIEKVFGEDIVGVDDLCKFLGIKPENTTKTLVYSTENGPIICSVRGDYEVNEIKLKKCAGVKSLKLADADTVTKVTGAKVGYAGISNIPEGIPMFLDDSLEPLVNFETGANETNYHLKNVNWHRDVKKPTTFLDIKEAKVGDIYPETGEVYEVFKAAEVGNIFPLYTKFTDALDYTIVDKEGKQGKVYMGCYGIGTTRAMGVIVEKYHDDKGIIWPVSVAPYHVHLITLGDSTDIQTAAECIYADMMKFGIEVLWDDRTDATAGEKFSDADLLGCPIRATVSARSMQNGGIEIKLRKESESTYTSLENTVTIIQDKLTALKDE